MVDQLKKIPVGSLESLKSVWAVLLGAAVGAYIGLYKKEYLEFVEPMGKIYLDILKMCVLPILLSAISVSIGRLITDRSNSQYLKTLFLCFFIVVIIASAIGVLLGVIGQPGGNLDNDTLKVLGSAIRETGAPDLELNMSVPFTIADELPLLTSFVFNLVPANIFSALTDGSNLKVLFFAILFGAAIGSIKNGTSATLISVMDAIYAAFVTLVQWLLYLLPFGFCGLIATSLNDVGFGALVAMLKFVIVALAAYFTLSLVAAVTMGIRTGSFWGSLKALREPMLVSLVTSSVLASLPATLSAMQKSLGYDKKSIDLIIPLSFNLCRIGPTLYFSVATMFVAQLYGVHLGMQGLLIVLFGSVLAGMATAGSSGIAMLTMLSIVLGPLGLPIEAVLVLFIVIDPIIAPLRVVASVHTACAIATVVIPKQESQLSNSNAPMQALDDAEAA